MVTTIKSKNLLLITTFRVHKKYFGYFVFYTHFMYAFVILM